MRRVNLDNSRSFIASIDRAKVRYIPGIIINLKYFFLIINRSRSDVLILIAIKANYRLRLKVFLSMQ